MKKNVDMYLTNKSDKGYMALSYIKHGVSFTNTNAEYVMLNMDKNRVKTLLNKVMFSNEVNVLDVRNIYFDISCLNKKFFTSHFNFIKHKPIKDKHVLLLGSIKTCDRVDVRRILPEDANDTVSGVKGETPSGFSITFEKGSIEPKITPYFRHVTEEKEVNDVEKNYIMVVSTMQRHLFQLINVNDVNKVFDITRDDKFKEIDYLKTDKDKLNDTILSLLNKYLPKYDNVKVSNIVKVLISEDASLTLGDDIICKPINVCTFFRECQIAINNNDILNKHKLVDEILSTYPESEDKNIVNVICGTVNSQPQELVDPRTKEFVGGRREDCIVFLLKKFFASMHVDIVHVTNKFLLLQHAPKDYSGWIRFKHHSNPNGTIYTVYYKGNPCVVNEDFMCKLFNFHEYLEDLILSGSYPEEKDLEAYRIENEKTHHVAKLPLAIIYRGLIEAYLQNNVCYINVHDICTEFVFSSKKLRGKGYLVVCLELLDNSDELVFVILKPSTKEMGIKFLTGIHEIINDLGITYNKIENFKPKLVYVAKVF